MKMEADPLFGDEDEDVFIEFAITPPLKQTQNRTTALRVSTKCLNDVPKKDAAPPKCPICSKDLINLNDARRLLHINNCLDSQESDVNFERQKKKIGRTMDCPICRKPLEEGPFCVAHIKKCSREHKVTGSEAMKLYETQKKVTDYRKEQGLRHTSAKSPKRKEVRAKPLRGQPRSLQDEQLQLAKALSISMEQQLEENFDNPGPSLTLAEILEEERKKELVTVENHGPNFDIVSEFSRRARKRRSYDIIAFTPESCACKQSHELQSRFLDLFKVKYLESQKTNSLNLQLLEDKDATYKLGPKVNAIYTKMARLSKLSSAFSSLADAFDPLSTGQIRLMAIGGGFMNVIREIFRRRTTVLNGVDDNVEEVDIEAPLDVMREWVRFVYSAKVEWTVAKNDQLLRIAEKYGPEELPSICRELNKRVETNVVFDDDAIECTPTDEK